MVRNLVDNKMKKLALISTFCNSTEKVNVLKENLLVLKDLQVETLVLSPIPLDEEIIKISTYCFFTKENPVLTWPERANTFWYSNLNAKGEYVEMHRDIDDYGWAGVYQMKKLSEIGLTMNYDIYYHMIYDLEITDKIKDDVKNNVINRTYHRINPKNNQTQWDVTLHFMIMDKENISYIAGSINKQRYIDLNGFAEEYVKNILSDLNLSKSDFDVRDKVRYIDADDNNIFNYSKTNEYKIFFGKWDVVSEDIGDDLWVVIYDIQDNKNVKIVLDDSLDIQVEHLTPIILNQKDFNKIEVITDSSRIEYTSIIEEISRNVIKYDKNFKKND